MEIIVHYLDKNLCFKKGEEIIPTMIMLHSTACPGVTAKTFIKAWNTPTPNGKKGLC